MQSHLQSPLYGLLNQIDMAARGGLDLLAISMAVALPDICVSLISDDGRTSAKAYKAWCGENLREGFEFVTPEDLYSIRCGVLHNGRFGDLQHSVARVIFVPFGGSTYVDGKLGDAYLYGVLEFCRNVNRAVVRWYEQHHETPTIVANVERLMRYHPGGLRPYFEGRTVVA